MIIVATYAETEKRITVLCTKKWHFDLSCIMKLSCFMINVGVRIMKYEVAAYFILL
jgi:hypothetical protein